MFSKHIKADLLWSFELFVASSNRNIINIAVWMKDIFSSLINPRQQNNFVHFKLKLWGKCWDINLLNGYVSKITLFQKDQVKIISVTTGQIQ